MAVEIQASYNKGFPVTLSDTVDHTFVAGMGRNPDAYIVTGTQGNLACVMQDGSVVSVSSAAGIPIPINARRINATGTTATTITALYII